MNASAELRVPRMGAWWEGGELCIRAWAPEHTRLEAVFYGANSDVIVHTVPFQSEPNGFFFARIRGAPRPVLYRIRVDGQGPFPDPWSSAQPLGVHGPSSVPTGEFRWTDSGWTGINLRDLILYEVHVGTATPAGTFEGLIEVLPEIRDLGATAIELLPLASFSGNRNWGYDGVSWFAPAQCYGGPEGLKKLINAAHHLGLAIVIDAVYNHFGPEGNYLRSYSDSYFTSKHKTPWGDAINYDGDHSAVVREMALSNAEMWVREYHADGLRLDATHAIVDDSASHLLQELAQRARAAAAHRKVLVMAEDERNESRLVLPPESGGYGLDAVWADDFHHQLRRAFAGDSEGYFKDYSGSMKDIAATLQEGWFYQGQHSKNLGRPRGTLAKEVPPESLIYCIQNHDQVGNRPFGNRLGDDVSPAAYRAMSTILLLSPYTPLLFAGQEWNAKSPFLYFTDHGAELGKLVTEGRRKEFAAFTEFGGSQIPDPQDLETFKKSKLNWAERGVGGHREVFALYRELLSLRKSHSALREWGQGSYRAYALGEHSFALERKSAGSALLIVVNVRGVLSWAPDWSQWRVLLSSDEVRFGGEWHDGRHESHRSALINGPCALVLERLDTF